jgi:hypothetical protein
MITLGMGSPSGKMRGGIFAGIWIMKRRRRSEKASYIYTRLGGKKEGHDYEELEGAFVVYR